MKHAAILTLLGCLSMAACSADPGAPSSKATTPAGSLGGVDLPDNGGMPTAVAPAEAPALQPMVPADFRDKNLRGGGCTFHARGDRHTLLIVKDQGDALVKFGNRLRRLTTGAPGRGAMAAGPILAGENVSIVVERIPQTTSPAAGSGKAWPATLTMRTSDGGERVYTDGQWECGD